MQLSANYPLPPIGSISALARILQVDRDELLLIQEDADNLYRLAKVIPKEDGTVREVFDAVAPLKPIQKCITRRILREVHFPIYLQGGVFDPDPARKRDDVRNAGIHIGARTLINEDIATFFPSLNDGHVLNVWKRFFDFPHDVSLCLTRLTTMNGGLPQGASTSTALANLAFWDREPEVVRQLNLRGITYSRFIDDVSISARRHLNAAEKHHAISMVLGMVGSLGCRPNRKKHLIRHSNKRMKVHNVTVNSGHPSVPKEHRNLIRARLHKLAKAGDSLGAETFMHEYNVLSGHIARITRMHPEIGKKFRSKLQSTKQRIAGKSF